MIRRNRKPRLNQKRAVPHVRSRQAPLVPTLTETLGNAVHMVFPLPIIVQSTPQWPDNVGVLPIGVSQADPFSVLVNYPQTPISPVTVPFEDPGVRGVGAGFVQPGTYTI